MTTLTINPNGMITGLYTEIIPLNTLGSLSVNRLSNVEFNESTQQWEVRNEAGELVFKNENRQTCLDWELQHFNQ